MVSQIEKAHQFKALHERDGCFVIPNPWDVGSVKILAHFGFEALATTSAGLAFSLGHRDGEGAISRDTVLANSQTLVEATALPISADLENGYANDPVSVGKTIQLAADIGLVGGSIEDTTANKDAPIRDLGLAVDCVRAAVEAKKDLPFPFILTARAENYLYGRPDLKDTIRRLQAYQEAGADVLYAPGLPSKTEIEAIVSAVDRPVNVIIGAHQLGVSDLTELGVKRVSIGSVMFRAAYGELFNAIHEIQDQGTFTFTKKAVPFADLNTIF
ncbi:MAG: isocitrate lyase/phosphoenolpyruvate mutase family protein [Chloroflexota bacterium]